MESYELTPIVLFALSHCKCSLTGFDTIYFSEWENNTFCFRQQSFFLITSDKIPTLSRIFSGNLNELQFCMKLKFVFIFNYKRIKKTNEKYRNKKHVSIK